MFPETEIGRNHWLFRAYLWQLDSTRYPAPSVVEAFKLSRRPIADTLKAMLIAGLGAPPEVHLDLVSEKTGISRLTLEAYEILFFNVLDRPQDGAYLSSIVYPQGRLVVYDEDYFETAPISDLMLRAAYDHRDIELVERLSGLDGSGYEAGLRELRDLERELEARFISTADVMARSEFLNQRSAAMERATALLAAQRSSRNQPLVEAAQSDMGPFPAN